MIAEIRKITTEQWFLIVALGLSLFLTFLFGYVVFRYSRLEICKSPMETGNFGETMKVRTNPGEPGPVEIFGKGVKVQK